MTKLFPLIFLLLLSACTTATHGVCRHKATYCGLVMGELYPVRIIQGRVSPSEVHAQAQAYIDGEWQWLEFRDGAVVIGKEERPFTGYEWDCTVAEYVRIMSEREK